MNARPAPWHTDASFPLARPCPSWLTVPQGPTALPGSAVTPGTIDGAAAKLGQVAAPAAGALTASTARASAAARGVRRIRMGVPFVGSGPARTILVAASDRAAWSPAPSALSARTDPPRGAPLAVPDEPIQRARRTGHGARSRRQHPVPFRRHGRLRVPPNTTARWGDPAARRSTHMKLTARRLATTAAATGLLAAAIPAAGAHAATPLPATTL